MKKHEFMFKVNFFEGRKLFISRLFKLDVFVCFIRVREHGFKSANSSVLVANALNIRQVLIILIFWNFLFGRKECAFLWLK